MATTSTRWPDPKTAAEKARRGIIDDSTASPDVLDMPDDEILKAAGLTAAEAERIVRDAEAAAAQQNGARGGDGRRRSAR